MVALRHFKSILIRKYTMAATYKYIDIGINLSDPVFKGCYHGKQAHEDDLKDVVSRAHAVGVDKMMITGSNLKESKHAIEVAEQFPNLCYATVGVHPCSVLAITKHPKGPQDYLSEIESLAKSSSEKGITTAFGEIGLDYDRLHFAPKETQLQYFEAQLEIAVRLKLPLFLHSRNAAEDFERLLKPKLVDLPKGGLVHSFTGSLEEMQQLVELNLDIGVNGCSLKTEENLNVVKEIPLDKLQIETDGPWCEIRPSHASYKYLEDFDIPKSVKKEKWKQGLMVKGRNEPVNINQVAHIIAKVKNITVEEVTTAAYSNSIKMFGLGVIS